MNNCKMHWNFVIVLIFYIWLMPISNAKDLHKDYYTTTATPTTLQRSTVAEGINSETTKEGVQKRDVTVTDLSSGNSVSAKSFDPPPEFYRGPGSTGSIKTPYYDNYNTNDNYKHSSGGFVSKPLTFPDAANIHSNFVPSLDNGAHLANSYNSWQNLKNKTAFFGALLNKTGIQDRISVGHFGNLLHNSRPYSGTHHQVDYAPSGHHYPSPSPHSAAASGGGYSYDARPHAPIDYNHHYGTSSHAGGSYYGGSAAAQGIPFDVYGGDKGHYAGTGGDYAYTYSDMHDSAAHKTYPDLSHKALLAKSFLIPLASAAVLGIAAALVSNPLLLQLGTVSGVGPGSVIGKRKRRQAPTTRTHTNGTTTGKDTTSHPYRAHHPRFVQT